MGTLNKKIAGYLKTAFDFEDQMSGDAYGIYLKRETWPEALDDTAFEAVKNEIEHLIEETERHKKLFRRYMINKNNYEF